jgi:N-methylhydantoinase A/oxoprolinase/acetone carboxylase beta subunit
MWYRLEIGKDGSIASCTEVAASFEDGKHVRYVEADSQTEALAKALTWYQEKEAKELAYWARQREIDIENMRSSEIRRTAREEQREKDYAARMRAERELETARESYAARAQATARRAVLRAVLRRFDADGPNHFRAWLVRELARLDKVARK